MSKTKPVDRHPVKNEDLADLIRASARNTDAKMDRLAASMEGKLLTLQADLLAVKQLMPWRK